MVGGAHEHDLNAPNADDGGDDANVERFCFEHDALLDVQFDECFDIPAARGIEAVRVAADAVERVAQLLSRRVGHIEHRGIKRSRHARGCRRTIAVFAGLLGEKVDDLDSVIKPIFASPSARMISSPVTTPRFRRNGPPMEPCRCAILRQ